MPTVQIKKMIAHYMDLTQNQPLLVDQIINITNQPEVVSFFTDHISKALTNKQIKSCKFTNSNGAVLQDNLAICTAPGNNQCYIDKTKAMTRRLFQFMKSSTSRSSGTMIYVIYEETETQREYLGILKMDPNEGIEFNPSTYQFTVRNQMLPSVKEKLHKTAFIKLIPTILNETIQLQVLDKQQKADGITMFFMTNFLEAEEVLQNKGMTKLLDQTLMDFAKEDKIAENIRPLSFKREVDRLLRNGDQIDVDNALDRFLTPYVPGEENRESLIEEIKQEMRNSNQDAHFIFQVEKDRETTGIICNSDKSIRFQYPLTLEGNRITITRDENEKVTIIKIEGEDMNETFK